MSGRNINRPWSEIEQQIVDDTETTAFNVDIARSLKQQVAVEKAVTGRSYKEIVTAALVRYLREQNGEEQS